MGAHCDRACQASTRNAARMRTYCAKRHSKRERAGRAEPRVSPPLPPPAPSSWLLAPSGPRGTGVRSYTYAVYIVRCPDMCNVVAIIAFAGAHLDQVLLAGVRL